MHKTVRLYENTGVANKMHFMEELMKGKMTIDENIYTNIARLGSIVGILRTVGTPVSK